MFDFLHEVRFFSYFVKNTQIYETWDISISFECYSENEICSWLD